MTLNADDRAALSDLVHRYAAAVDDRQFDSAANLFADDADLLLPDPPTTLTPATTHSGRAAITKAVATVASTIRTQHQIVGEVYDADAQTGVARGRIACVAHHWVRHDETIRDVIWHLRYVDEYQRSTDAPWRIHSRALTIDAIDTRPIRQVRPRQP